MKVLKEKEIYWLFSDGSVGYHRGRPFMSRPIAWKFESNHPWNYNMLKAPSNYYSYEFNVVF